METMKFEEASPAEGGASQGENNSDAQRNRSSDQKRRRKLIWAGIIVAALILAVIGWQYWQYTQSPYYQQMKAVKEIEKMAKESDKWGGKTPEETVRLFTEAVKKGDFDLAAKYGYPELGDPLVKNPQTIKTELEKMKADGQMDLLIRELEIGKIKEFSGGGGDANLIADIDGLKVRVLSMHKSESGTWKIDEF